jgi:dihydrofolate reductase
MTKVRVHDLTVSLDGYAAGPDQSEDNPLGVGGEQLHGWATSSRTWRRAHGEDVEDGPETLDDRMIAAGIDGIGATVMGRRMFGPRVHDWDGWWGDEPPFHHPVLVVTSTEREPLVLGDTTFHFVAGGLAAAVDRAKEAAGGKDVRIGGGAQTVRTAMELGLVDSLHLVQAPVLLGAGERLLEGSLPYRVSSTERSDSGVLHIHLEKA